MPRDRHQNGFVEEVGKKTKKWKGHYFEYQREPDGRETRKHRGVILGLKSEMKKWEAQRKLQELIAKSDQDGAAAKPSPVHTLRWFWQQRYKPMKLATWKPSSAPNRVFFIDRYVMTAFGETPLGELNRFAIQTHLNSLSEKFSSSVVRNFRMEIKAILDEAVEEDFIGKNPARKLTLPRTRKPKKRCLSILEIGQLLSHMSGRDRLIIRMFLVLALRPGELFALRRNDRLSPNVLLIDESISQKSGIVEPKTQASHATVWVPNSLSIELDFWLDAMEDQRPEAFLFASRSKRQTPISPNNFLKRVLKITGERTVAALKKDGIEVPDGFLEGLTHQALRRTCATHMQHKGSVKDIQAHLRHARPDVTAAVYMQEIPATVRAAVEDLDSTLRSAVPAASLPVN